MIRQQSKEFTAAALEVTCVRSRYLRVQAQEWVDGTFVLYVDHDWREKATGTRGEMVYLAHEKDASRVREFKALGAAYREAKRFADAARAYLHFGITHNADGWRGEDEDSHDD